MRQIYYMYVPVIRTRDSIYFIYLYLKIIIIDLDLVNRNQHCWEALCTVHVFAVNVKGD